jgi:uncharacterized protein YdiU (UPF0061 family)
LEQSAEKIASMVAHWIRVGFAQGNFNADNCLVGGNTMDYGPFGFVEEYNPLFAKWIGSGEHFGFMNQPNAGYANYKVLVQSVAPVISAAGSVKGVDVVVDSFMKKAARTFQTKLLASVRAKIGLEQEQEIGDPLWQALDELMQAYRVDWTIFFRQLTYVMRDFPDLKSTDYEGMLSLLEGDEAVRPGSSAFYEPLSSESREKFSNWIQRWRGALLSTKSDAAAVFEDMRLTNPKFIPREWMLVDAYNCAGKGEDSKVHDLHELFQHPYDEGTDEQTAAFYRRAPEVALTTGGTAFMS